MADTPSAILCRAADLIRDRAAAASPGVWTAEDMADAGHPGVWWVDCVHREADGTTYSTIADLESVGAGSNARWIALLSPDKAEHIEAWLRQVQHRAARSEESARLLGWPAPVYREEVGPALAFARGILGEEVTEDVR